MEGDSIVAAQASKIAIIGISTDELGVILDLFEYFDKEAEALTGDERETILGFVNRVAGKFGIDLNDVGAAVPDDPPYRYAEYIETAIQSNMEERRRQRRRYHA